MAESPEEFDESELRNALKAIRSQTADIQHVETLAMASLSVEEGARFYAAALDTVGAVENADLLARLADAVLPHLAGKKDEPVEAFQRFRKEVDGPFFGLPKLNSELAEAMLEWSLEHADEFAYTG